MGQEHTANYLVTPADFGNTNDCWLGLENVISVGSSRRDGLLAGHSDFGSGKVDIVAPGEGVWTDRVGDGLSLAHGTSFASPHLAGAVSLARSMRPDLSYLDIKNALLGQADVIPALSGKIDGNRSLNLYTTLKYLLETSHISLLTGQYSGYAIGSGATVPTNTINFQRNNMSNIGSFSGYTLQVQYSGITIQTRTTTQTGTDLVLASGDGQYTVSVFPIFTS